MNITMSVSRRIVIACQLDDGSILHHYGLTYVPSPRVGYWFTGTEEAWRKLADDVDSRASGGWSPDCALNRRDSLTSRINRAVAKQTVTP